MIKYRDDFCTVVTLFKGHPDKRPPSLVRPLDNAKLNINVLISTPNERPPSLKGHFSDAKGVASLEGFHCIYIKTLVLLIHGRVCLTVS